MNALGMGYFFVGIDGQWADGSGVWWKIKIFVHLTLSHNAVCLTVCILKLSYLRCEGNRYKRQRARES